MPSFGNYYCDQCHRIIERGLHAKAATVREEKMVSLHDNCIAQWLKRHAGWTLTYLGRQP